MIKSIAFFSMFTLSIVTASSAETPEQRQACTDDAFRVCNDAIPDQNRVFNCLVQKQAQISPLCRSALAAYLPPEQPTAQAKQTGKSKAKNRSNSSARPGKGPLNLNPNAR